jgi:hypothetical protein
MIGGETSGGGGDYLGTITLSDDVRLVGTGNRTESFLGAIVGTGNITVTGESGTYYDSSAVALAGTSTNTFNGSITVNSGRLVLAKPAGVTAIPSDITIGDGSGTYRHDGINQSANEQIGDTATMTLFTPGEYEMNGKTETFNTLWVNGTGVVATEGGRLALGTDPGEGTGIIVNGGVLGGNGFILDTVDVIAGTVIAGYENFGALTFSNAVTFGENAVAHFTLSETNSTRLVSTDALTLDGSIELTGASEFKPALGTLFGLIKTDGTVTGTMKHSAKLNDIPIQIIYTGSIDGETVSTTGGDDVVAMVISPVTIIIVR